MFVPFLVKIIFSFETCSNLWSGKHKCFSNMCGNQWFPNILAKGHRSYHNLIVNYSSKIATLWNCCFWCYNISMREHRTKCYYVSDNFYSHLKTGNLLMSFLWVTWSRLNFNCCRSGEFLLPFLCTRHFKVLLQSSQIQLILAICKKFQLRLNRV